MAIEMPANIIRSLSRTEKLELHIYHTRPILNYKALFADGSDYYFSPMEPDPGDEVTIRFRTAKDNAEHVFFLCDDKRHEMEVVSSNERFDYYEIKWIMPEDTLVYCFEIISNGTHCFYNKKGPLTYWDSFFDFRVKAGFSTPDWAKGAVFYQIFVDRFKNGDPTNDVVDNEYIYIGEKVKQVHVLK